MKIALISGKYRGETQWEVQSNIDLARQAAGKLCKRGIFPITPHLNTSHFEGLQPDSFWLEGYLEILERCDMIFMLSNWRSSKGATAELKRAMDLGLEVEFESINDTEL